MKLRPYQIEAKSRILEELKHSDSTLVVLPTGMGKTHVFCDLAAAWDGRCLVSCPTLQLLDQTAQKLQMVTGEEPDIEQASNFSDQQTWARSKYVCASRQSLAMPTAMHNRRYERMRDISLLIIDEAHQAVNERTQEMVNWFVERGAKVVGFTATPKRHDKRALGAVYDSVAYAMSIYEAVPEGWLVGSRVTCTQLETLDLSDVAVRGNDFQETGEHGINRLLEDDKTVYEIASITHQRMCGDKTVVYCGSVSQARHVSNVLADVYGVRAEWICGDASKCPPARRYHILKDFHGGSLEVVCNVGILTTGWDFPELKHIVLARPMRSLPLFTQIYGRGTRSWPGVIDGCETAEERVAAIESSPKPFFRITDLRDNSLKHRLATVTDVLGGSYDLKTRQFAYDASLGGEDVDPMELLDQAQNRVIEEMRKREELRKRRADAKFRARLVDVCSPGGSTAPDQKTQKQPIWPMHGQNYKKPLNRIRTGALVWYLENRPMKAYLRKQVLMELESRGVHCET